MRRMVVNGSYEGQRVTGQQRYATEVVDHLEPGSIVVVRPRGFWAGSRILVWAWVQLVLPLLARGDVVLSLTARGPVWCRRHVLVVHDLFVLTNPEWYSRAYVWTHAPLLRTQIRFASALMAVSRPVADQLAALGRDDVAVAPNAPAEVFINGGNEPSPLLSEKGVAPGSYFLAVGSRDPRKNLHRLSEAYTLLEPEVRARHPLVLVGGTSSIYRDQAIEWPSGTVDAGYVDDEELRRLYRDARSVVFVSLAEGFGLPLVEAAAAGADSMVISDIEVFHWVCGDGPRYVDPKSASSIAAGMRAEIQKRSNVAIDPSRFTWESSARVVERTCRAASGGF